MSKFKFKVVHLIIGSALCGIQSNVQVKFISLLFILVIASHYVFLFIGEHESSSLFGNPPHSHSNNKSLRHISLFAYIVSTTTATVTECTNTANITAIKMDCSRQVNKFFCLLFSSLILMRITLAAFRGGGDVAR